MLAKNLGPKILSAKIVSADNRGPKVLVCKDGEIIKYFRRGRLLTHHGYLPRAIQFQRNAQLIRKIGLRAPMNIAVIDGHNGKNTAVRYRPISGTNLMSAIEASKQSGFYCRQLGGIFRKLHDNGIVFKANHLANFIHQEDQPMGMIDLDNLYRLPCQLPRQFRLANLRRLVRHDVETVNVPELLNGYFAKDPHNPKKPVFAEALSGQLSQ